MDRRLKQKTFVNEATEFSLHDVSFSGVSLTSMSSFWLLHKGSGFGPHYNAVVTAGTPQLFAHQDERMALVYAMLHDTTHATRHTPLARAALVALVT